MIKTFGESNYKSMPDEVYWQLRFEPAKWIAEKHIVKVYVGTDGLHQDEFLRGDHPSTLFRGSIATPSLEAAIINAKYVNSNPLDRISRDFQTNGLQLSKQTMSNWTVWTAERYFQPVYDWMKKRQLEAHTRYLRVADQQAVKAICGCILPEDSVQVRRLLCTSTRRPGTAATPQESYKDFKGVLMTDGLEKIP